MRIILNGTDMEVPENTSVRDVMTRKRLPEGVSVVALNDEVVQRDLWQRVNLKADDRMDVIRIVGGG